MAGTNLRPISRNILAQDIMDLYYQEIKSEEDFFDIGHFIRQVDYAYGEVLKAEYDRLRKEMREDLQSKLDYVTFESDWQTHERLELQREEESGLFYVTPSKGVFSFPYGDSMMGYQNLLPIQRGTCTLVRSSLQRLSLMEDFLPSDSGIVYWWPAKDKVYLTADCCKVVNLWYIPTIGADALLMPGVAGAITRYVLDIMFKAREGVVVDETNNQNSNKTMASEISRV